MVINEQGLLRAMKEAYKADGYEIECIVIGNMTEIHLETSRWYVNCEIKNLPRKVLGLIAEHLGELPSPGQCFQVKKNESQTRSQGAKGRPSAALLPMIASIHPAFIKQTWCIATVMCGSWAEATRYFGWILPWRTS